MNNKLVFCTPANVNTPTTTAVTVVGPNGIQHAEIGTEKLLAWITQNAGLRNVTQGATERAA